MEGSDLPTTTPQFCRPRAYELFAAQLPGIESPRALLTAAVALAMHEIPDADPAQVDAHLQRYADRVRLHVRRHHDEALLAHLHALLFEEEGFRGNNDDYYNTANSYIPLVLSSKRGIPISLSLIYCDVADRLGLKVSGINAPNHFLVSVVVDGSTMLVDPYFEGRTMSRSEAAQRMRQIVPDISTDTQANELLQPATHRQWLTRMLGNLMAIHHRAGRSRDLAAMAELRNLL